jgi:hypothetical protein
MIIVYTRVSLLLSGCFRTMSVCRCCPQRSALRPGIRRLVSQVSGAFSASSPECVTELTSTCSLLPHWSGRATAQLKNLVFNFALRFTEKGIEGQYLRGSYRSRLWSYGLDLAGIGSYLVCLPDFDISNSGINKNKYVRKERGTR